MSFPSVADDSPSAAREGFDRGGWGKCGSSYTPRPSLPGHTGVPGFAGRFASGWSRVCEVVSPSCSEGCRIMCRPAGLFICNLASGQGLPGERSPSPLPGCLSQGTPIKGTNWTTIHQSPPRRLALRSSGGPVVRLLF